MNIQPLHDAERRFKEAGIETARLDAKVLWEYNPTTFEQSVARRLKHEPVAYITGVKEFWSIPIKVTPAVLIPRPETEHVVEMVLKLISPSPLPSPLKGEGVTILDLCTGSGCIVAALAKELPKATFVATDISPDALNVAKENLGFAKGRVTLLQGNLFSALRCHPECNEGSRSVNDPTGFFAPLRMTPSFDIVTINPPYIPDGQWPTLAPDITQYEPKQALTAGPAGLDFIQRIIEDAPQYLKPGGWLVMEIGENQAQTTMKIAQRVGKYGTIHLTKDLAGIERVISLRHG